MRDLDLALRNLRHLYEQMLVPGCVFNTASAAKGLLGPAIEKVERLQSAATDWRGEIARKPSPTDAEVKLACAIDA